MIAYVIRIVRVVGISLGVLADIVIIIIITTTTTTTITTTITATAIFKRFNMKHQKIENFKSGDIICVQKLEPQGNLDVTPNINNDRISLKKRYQLAIYIQFNEDLVPLAHGILEIIVHFALGNSPDGFFIDLQSGVHRDTYSTVGRYCVDVKLLLYEPVEVKNVRINLKATKPSD
jgi:hypothetical protein